MAYEAPESASASKRSLSAAMRDVADRLGNTPAVARKSYVHPAVLSAYLDGSLGTALLTEAEDDAEEPSPAASRAEEEAVIELIRRRLEAERPARRRRPRCAKATSSRD
jgi:DNA topoisomerase-1